MSSAEPKIETYLVVLPDERREHVLTVRRSNGRLELPAVTTPRELPNTIAAVAEHIAPAVFLRTLARIREPERPRVSLVEYDTPHGDPRLDAPIWHPVDRIDQLDVPEELANPLRRWASGLGSADVPELRAPWARPGWYDRFVTWIAESLRSKGIEPTGRPIPVQQWGISAVLRQPTDQGDFYAKAVFRVFAAEPTITTALAARTPGLVPEIIAVDIDNGWMLMPDMRIRPADELPADQWSEPIRVLARIQRAWVGRTDELIEHGCPDRSPARLADQVLEALAYPASTQGLEPAELGRVRALIPAWQELCEAARADPVPLTLMHGDFHTGNAGIRPDGSVCLYDWSDSAIGHPFQDVEVYVRRGPEEVRPQLRKAYLAEWPEVGDADRLLARANVLSALHQVVTYQGIRSNLEPDDQPVFDGAGAWWWRAALDLWDAFEAEDFSTGAADTSDAR